MQNMHIDFSLKKTEKLQEMTNIRLFGTFSALFRGLSSLDQGRSAPKWSLGRNSLHPPQGCRETFRRGAERCTDERSRETQAGSRRALPRRQLSLRQRHRVRLPRTALQRSLTARPPHAGPRGPACHPRPQRQLAGLLSDRPLWDPPGAGGPGDRSNLRFWLRIPRAAGSPVPRSSGGAGTSRDNLAPHAGWWSFPQPLAILRALLLRLASRLLEICHLLSPHR